MTDSPLGPQCKFRLVSYQKLAKGGSQHSCSCQTALEGVEGRHEVHKEDVVTGVCMGEVSFHRGFCSLCFSWCKSVSLWLCCRGRIMDASWGSCHTHVSRKGESVDLIDIQAPAGMSVIAESFCLYYSCSYRCLLSSPLAFVHCTATYFVSSLSHKEICSVTIPGVSWCHIPLTWVPTRGIASFHWSFVVMVGCWPGNIEVRLYVLSALSYKTISRLFYQQM